MKNRELISLDRFVLDGKSNGCGWAINPGRKPDPQNGSSGQSCGGYDHTPSRSEMESIAANEAFSFGSTPTENEGQGTFL